ncbi:MAG: hypothetical protein AABY15_04625 [Nanoarchaeota archaeon]
MEVNLNSFIIKKNDTLPSLSIDVTDVGCLGEKIPYNLSAVTAVTFTMVDDCGNFKVLNQSADIVCDSGGTIEYNWSSEDTDTEGDFLGEFRLSFSGGTRMTLPTKDSIRIHIPNSVNPF